MRVEDIAEIISKLTGIPVTELTAEEREKLLQMEERLHQRVDRPAGSDHRGQRRRAPGPRRAAPGQPADRHLSVPRPAGVGKNELAKALARWCSATKTR
ncbi:hypothetical protein P4132_20625 [Pseudomonas aeruginosa]|nr:hypothetical protein [Pseudomonas aeruginosa]